MRFQSTFVSFVLAYIYNLARESVTTKSKYQTASRVDNKSARSTYNFTIHEVLVREMHTLSKLIDEVRTIYNKSNPVDLMHKKELNLWHDAWRNAFIQIISGAKEFKLNYLKGNRLFLANSFGRYSLRVRK